MQYQKSQLLFFLFLAFIFFSCSAQEAGVSTVKTKVGGPCQGCEAVFEFGNRELTSIDTLPNFQETSPKLKVSGSVYQKDGKTPAAGVILYIYQTNRAGIYEKKGDEQNWGKRHGYIRGWVKTGKDGSYTFYTFRPGAYPNRRAAEHIHLTIKEPNRNEYYADNFVFEDDPLLTEEEKKSLPNRCGSGILKLSIENEMLTAKRDLILGLNIPNYE